MNNFQTHLLNLYMDPNMYNHSGSEWTWSNGNKEMTPHSPDFQNWTLITGCSLISCLRCPIKIRYLPTNNMMYDRGPNLFSPKGHKA